MGLQGLDMELLPLPTFWFLSHCSLAAGFIPLALELCFVSIRLLLLLFLLQLSRVRTF